MILGAKTKEGVAVSFTERMEGTLHIHGFETDTLDNGEKLTWQSMGQVLAEKGPVDSNGRWSLMRGTGRFKGIKGGGTYEGKLEANDVLTLNLTAFTTRQKSQRKRNEEAKDLMARRFWWRRFSRFCLALPAFAQQSETATKGPIVIQEFKHDTGPLLREVAPLLPEFSAPSEHEIENNVVPSQRWSNQASGNRPGAADGGEFSELADAELRSGIRWYRLRRQLFLQLHAPGQ